MEPAQSTSSRDNHVVVDLGSSADVTQIARSCSAPPVSPHQVYHQLPLTAEAIRILDLDCPADETAPLTGTLRVSQLKDCPNFTALSYVWGKGGTTSIYCNGCGIAITPNCQEALLSLRSMYGGISIWVDAICINQEDDIEKDRQIPIMGQIYTWASVVYIWLGPENDKCTRAIESLKTVSALRLPRFGPPWIDGRRRKTVASDRIACLVQSACFMVQHFFQFTFIPGPCSKLHMPRWALSLQHAEIRKVI